VCLTDAQIQTEMNNVQNVGSCFDSSNGTCAFTQYCAYHGQTGAGAI